MWNSFVGMPRACSASANTSSSDRVYPPSSFGIRANEQNVQVFRSTQMLVGLMCWLAEKKTRSPFRRWFAMSASRPRPVRSLVE